MRAVCHNCGHCSDSILRAEVVGLGLLFVNNAVELSTEHASERGACRKRMADGCRHQRSVNCLSAALVSGRSG